MVIRFQAELHTSSSFIRMSVVTSLSPVELRNSIDRNALVEVEERVDSKDQSASYWLGHRHGSQTVKGENFS